MKILNLVLAFFTACCLIGLLQFTGCSGDDDVEDNPIITFYCTFGGDLDDEGSSVRETSDGGYIVAGNTRDVEFESAEVYLIRVDSNGKELWSRMFGGVTGDNGKSVYQTSDGGFVVAGCTNSFGAADHDIYLIKTDNSGNALWSETFGGDGTEYGFSVQQTNDAGFIIAGGTCSFGNGSWDVYLMKTDDTGHELWFKTYGGQKLDFGRSCQQTSDGGYVIVGETMSFGMGFSDVYLIKTDDMGNELWFKTFEGYGWDYANSVRQTSDDGYVITGYTQSPLGDDLSVYLITTDDIGNEIWSKTFGDTGHNTGHSVQQTDDGGYIIAGNTYHIYGEGQYDVYLLKTDGSGNECWWKTFGGSHNDRANSVQQTSDGGFVITGETYSSITRNRDVLLIKTDKNGDIIRS